MKIRSIFSLAFVFGILIIAGCNIGDKTGPVISILHPSESAMFAPGDTMHIHTTIVEDEAMHMVTVEVTNTATSAVLFTEEVHEHDLSSTYLADVILDVPNDTDLSVKVTAEDEAENMSEQSVHVHVTE